MLAEYFCPDHRRLRPTANGLLADSADSTVWNPPTVDSAYTRRTSLLPQWPPLRSVLRRRNDLHLGAATNRSSTLLRSVTRRRYVLCIDAATIGTSAPLRSALRRRNALYHDAATICHVSPSSVSPLGARHPYAAIRADCAAIRKVRPPNYPLQSAFDEPVIRGPPPLPRQCAQINRELRIFSLLLMNP